MELRPVIFRNRRISWNSRGYSYLNLPREAAKALNCGLVDIIVLPDGVLLKPKGPELQNFYG